jgi:uncharacterized protein with GYD domain
MWLDRLGPTKEETVPTYIVLINWTEQGIRDFKQTTDRADAAAELAKSLGGELKDVYWCLGPYDIVGVLDAPDDETATAFALQQSSRGAIRTSTMRAFNREEIEGIVAKAG